MAKFDKTKDGGYRLTFENGDECYSDGNSTGWFEDEAKTIPYDTDNEEELDLILEWYQNGGEGKFYSTENEELDDAIREALDPFAEYLNGDEKPEGGVVMDCATGEIYWSLEPEDEADWLIEPDELDECETVGEAVACFEPAVYFGNLREYAGM